MIRAKVEVRDTKIDVIYSSVFTAGMIGAEVEIDYKDPAWDALNKTVVFMCDAVTKDVVSSERVIEVAPEVLKDGQKELYMGIYGCSDDGKLVIPTLWVKLGNVHNGADPSGDPSTDPSLPVWAQLHSMIGELSKLSTEDRTSLVAAINELAKTGGGGGVDFETDHTLTLKDGVLSVNTTNAMEQDNTLPITSAGVYATVGNIEALLKTI